MKFNRWRRAVAAPFFAVVLFQAACHRGQSPRYILSDEEHTVPCHQPKSVVRGKTRVHRKNSGNLKIELARRVVPFQAA